MLHIITDSSAEITQEEAKKLGVEIIPLTIVFGDTAYLDGVEITKGEFYSRLLSGEFPNTAQPSPAQLEEVFRRTNGEETLVLLISSALSGTTDTARLIARDFPNVHVYDTLCTTCMLRYLVEAAVKNREKPLKEVVSILDELRPRIHLYACVDTLEYLHKGGRVSKTVAVVGDLLRVKPIIGVSSDGHVVMVGRAHGQRKALKDLSDRMLAEQLDPEWPVYFLQSDTDAPTRTVMAACGRTDDRIFQICCAVGTHIGPNAAGIVYVVKE